MTGQGWPWNCFEVACFEILSFITLVLNAYFQTEESVYHGDKQRETHEVRKSTPTFQNHEVWCKPGQY